MCFIIIIPSFNNIFESGINKKLFLKCSLNPGPSPSRKQKRCFYIIETGERVLKKRITTFAFRADELYNQKNFQDTSRDKLDVTRGPEELSPHLM